MVEAKRMQQFGFSADELDRAKAGLLAGYERAYKERETAESPSYANEYVRHFLQQEPIPGIEFEYKIAVDLPADGHRRRGRRARQGADHRREPRRARRSRRRRRTRRRRRRTRCARRSTRASTAPVERWAEATAGRELVEKPPAAGKVASRRTVAEIGATVLTLSNGVEVWLKPTDFKNDQMLFSAYAPGGVSLAPEPTSRAPASRPRWSASAAWAGSAPSISARCCRARSRRRRRRSADTRRASADRARRRISRPRCS